MVRDTTYSVSASCAVMFCVHCKHLVCFPRLLYVCVYTQICEYVLIQK